MGTALITGIEGFTGRYLAEELARRGHAVAGIGIRPRPERVPLNEYGQVDLLDVDATTSFVARIRPDMVFHLAGISHVQSAPDVLYRINIASGRNLIAALVKLESPPFFTMLASSANLYGNTGGVLDESTPPDPRNDYAVSKLAVEYMANIWRDQLPITIVRPFNYTGCGQSESFLIPKLVKHFRDRLPVIELGNTHVIREFGDVRDVASIYVRLAKARAPWGPFNICSGAGYTLNQVLDMLRELTGHAPDIRINRAFVRPNEVDTLIGSTKKLEDCIGEIHCRGLKATLAWMLDARE